jgi:hypothetical protein
MRATTMIEGRNLRDRRSDLIRSIGLGIAYFVAAQLSLRLAHRGPSPIDRPSVPEAYLSSLARALAEPG